MSEDIILERISPFFIVKNLIESIEFYNLKLGFKTDLLIPEDNPFFGIVSPVKLVGRVEERNPTRNCRVYHVQINTKWAFGMHLSGFAHTLPDLRHN